MSVRVGVIAPAAITLLIGPEGGFAALRAGYRALRLLRSETATVAALSALQALWGDVG